MKSVLVLAVVLLVAHAAPSWIELQPAAPLQKGVGDIWSNCSGSADKAKILDVSISPDPPQEGKPLTVFADVMLYEEVTGGSIKVDIKFGFITVIDKTFDLCTELKTANLTITCPVPAGHYKETLKEIVPKVPISGTIKGNVKVTDQNGAELACVNIDFHI